MPFMDELTGTFLAYEAEPLDEGEQKDEKYTTFKAIAYNAGDSTS